MCSGSLTPTFVPAWLVGLTVKLAYAFALSIRFPSVPSQPLNASVTLWEATAPVKLPTRHCSSTGIYGQSFNKGLNLLFESSRTKWIAYYLVQLSLSRLCANCGTG